MIVIPMAGASSRFRKAGYTKPKYMLDYHGQSIFSHVLLGFRKEIQQEGLVLICRDFDGTKDFVTSELNVLRPFIGDNISVSYLDQLTAGQAETVYEGLESLNIADNQSITIFNIDTINKNFSYPDHFALNECDGYLETFEADGDHWSFILPDDHNNVKEVTEKVRISNLCSSGLYYFAKYAYFKQAYLEMNIRPLSELQGGEKYIAPLYNLLIQKKMRIKYHAIQQDHFIFCGTPDEYQAAIAKQI